jgi:hypothetical protein
MWWSRSWRPAVVDERAPSCSEDPNELPVTHLIHEYLFVVSDSVAVS